jgi:hypothetical protein
VLLPPRGSAQDKILEEIHLREREERFTLVALFARILGLGLNMREDTLGAMLNTYRDELTQVRYTPAYAAYLRRRKAAVVSKKIRKQLDDDTLFKRLEGMTAPEETAPAKKAGARRR